MADKQVTSGRHSQVVPWGVRLVWEGGHLAGSLLQAVLGVCVVQLDGPDAPQVQQVAAQLLRASPHLALLRLAAQLLCLPTAGSTPHTIKQLAVLLRAGTLWTTRS